MKSSFNLSGRTSDASGGLPMKAVVAAKAIICALEFLTPVLDLGIRNLRFTRTHEADEESRETLGTPLDDAAGKTATPDQRTVHSFYLPKFRSSVHHANSNF